MTQVKCNSFHLSSWSYIVTKSGCINQVNSVKSSVWNSGIDKVRLMWNWCEVKLVFSDFQPKHHGIELLKIPQWINTILARLQEGKKSIFENRLIFWFLHAAFLCWQIVLSLQLGGRFRAWNILTWFWKGRKTIDSIFSRPHGKPLHHDGQRTGNTLYHKCFR